MFGMNGWCKEIPGGDLISRAAAIQYVNERPWMTDAAKDVLIDKLKRLPSAQPYTDEEIQAMQDLEQAQLDKAYQIGVEEGLKSTQPERKKGKWIPHEDEDGEHYGDKCSECGEWYVMPYGKTRFCPNCGAEMEVSE